MDHNQKLSRRALVQSSAFGLLAVSVPNIIYSRETSFERAKNLPTADLFHRYPAIDDTIVAEVVGVSHFNLDRLKELVDKRPELSRATWDWGFGDWETAIGAASHVGRKDIVSYLMNKGARPDIFTFAMLGAYTVVKSMIDHSPGIQRTYGPHGISLLQHAKTGSESGETSEEKINYDKLVDYLESLGDADVREVYLESDEADKQKYLGDYKYGDGPDDGFTIQINSRKNLSMGKIGKFGGTLSKTGNHRFAYNRTPSVQIIFLEEKSKIVSLAIHEPEFMLTATKVS